MGGVVGAYFWIPERSGTDLRRRRGERRGRVEARPALGLGRTAEGHGPSPGSPGTSVRPRWLPWLRALRCRLRPWRVPVEAWRGARRSGSPFVAPDGRQRRRRPSPGSGNVGGGPELVGGGREPRHWAPAALESFRWRQGERRGA